MQRSFGPAQRRQFEVLADLAARLALFPAATDKKIHTHHIATLAMPTVRMDGGK